MLSYMYCPHAFFQRRGHDIWLDLQINVAQAALGDEVKVPTVDRGRDDYHSSGHTIW